MPMLQTLTKLLVQPTPVVEFQDNEGRVIQHSLRYDGRIVRHAIFIISAFFLYLLLNRPEVILLSKLGSTAWYPAAGLLFAVMLAISPRYMVVFALANALAGMLIFHQPFYSWGTLVGAPAETVIYALAAYLLRGPIKIDSSLGQRRDVNRYVFVTSVAAIFSTLTGILCLLADHTIQPNQFWDDALVWYSGDTIGLLSVAPFLLIHVLPWINNSLKVPSAQADQPRDNASKALPAITPLNILEYTGQAFAFALVLWIMFGAPAPKQFYYLAFLPITWIAMRQGIRGSVIGLLALNFGIVVSLRFAFVSGEGLTKLTFLMLAISATGLTLGSVVTERNRIANDLKERTIFLNSLINNSPFGIVVHNGMGKIQLYNHAFANLFLYNASEITGEDLGELIIPAEQRSEAIQMNLEVSSGQTVHKAVRRKRRDGQVMDVDVHISPTFQGGKVHGAYVIYKDISDQVKATVAAKEHTEEMNRWVGELQLRTLQITLLNELGGLLQCAESSEEAYNVVGQSAKKLFVGTSWGALFVRKPSQRSLEIAVAWGNPAFVEPEFAPDDCWSLRLGQPYWSECPSRGVICAHVNNSHSANYLCIPMMAQGEALGVLHICCDPDASAGDAEADQKFRESQKRLAVAAASQIALSLANLRLRETLRDQSIRDPLTGLYNRRFMHEALDKELQRAKRKNRSLAIVFLDIDHFKRFNDVYGHDAGDRVLQSVADVFRLNFRAEDVICRYGGEEFAVILPEASTKDAYIRAETLRMAARGLKLVHRGMLLEPVTLSIGISGFPEHGENAQDLLDRADKCTYESKANGRDCVTLATP